MGKRIVYTQITPLPSNIPRQLALDMLHSHGEIIEINPLVTGHRSIPAPRDAARDEFFAQWYEIDEIITWGFGMKKKIAFKAVFHDMPWGLQTHTYAPMGVDLRNKYQVCGNQPGEPREVRELGIDAPTDGLYLREDVEIVCNIALASYVKKETKQTLGTMISRMTKKAELLDDGVLHAMFENGKLKTLNPNQPQQKDSGLATPSLTSSFSSTPASPLPGADFGNSGGFQKYSNLTDRTSHLGPGAVGHSPVSEGGMYTRTFTSAVELDATEYPDEKKNFAVELPDTEVPNQVRHSFIKTPAQYIDTGRQESLASLGSFRSDGRPHSQSVSSQYTHNSSVSTPPPVNAYNGATPPPLQPRHPDHHVSIDREGNTSTRRSYNLTNPDPPSASYQQQQQQYAGLAIDEKLACLNINNTSRVLASGEVQCSICSDFAGSKDEVSRHINRNHFSP